MIELYGIIGILALVLLAVLWFWIKDHSRQKRKRIEAENEATKYEMKLSYLQAEMEEALNYESRDTEIQKQINRNIEVLRNAKTDEDVKKEIDSIRSNLRDISRRI